MTQVFIFYVLLIALSPHVVKAKEELFKNFYDNLKDSGKTLIKFADDVGLQAIEFYRMLDEAIKDECELICPKDMKLVQRHHPIHRSKGCGYFGVDFFDWELSECCQDHNVCYETCNSDKDGCDKMFRKCLFNVCEKYVGDVSNVLVKGCKVIGHTVYTGSMALGCKSFKDAQKENCVCVH